MKEKFQAINFPNGIEFNNKLFQSIGVNLENVENVDIDAKAYLIEQLGIEDNQLRDDSKNLIQRNFIHLICQVRNDLSTIEERLKKYKKERADLDGVKSNEAEYRRRKLEYFTKMNKSAQNDIVLFLTKGITGYLKEIQYDTLQRECAKDDCGKIFRNRRYLFAQFPEYYDADFDYSTVVKMSQLPGINLIDVPKIEKKYLEMHRNNLEKYYCEIKKIINQKRITENLKEGIEKNYHLHKRCEMFMDLARLYEEKHYQSFIGLGLLQLEGVFFDICSIRYDGKENAGTLVEKVEKVLRGKNQVYYNRFYPYFAFDVPVKRNEIAHTGLINSQKLEQIADEVLLDLNAVVQMAKTESEDKFRLFFVIFDNLSKVNSTDEKQVNETLIVELYETNMISPDSFWSVLKSPDLFKDELDFYKLDHIQEGYMDLPNIVKYISGLVRQIPFWTEMVNLLNLDGINKDLQDFLLSMAKDYINVLDNDCKMKCIEILKALQ